MSHSIDFTTLKKSPLTHLQDGETYEIPFNTIGGLLVTSGSSMIYFDVKLPKSAADFSGAEIEIQSLDAELRGPGGYLSATGSGIHDIINLSSDIAIYPSDNSLTLAATKKSGVWHSTNNATGVIMIKDGSIKFAK